ncbi:alpha-keto acid decarboxylase family protein [Salinispora arenicola]|uniref:alpha-keto acid decarboxylase family protein n=1 Tax=Salinispora arenicola TaxID=168697 RepID=UPI00169F47B3|nr:thiamine pyrophosphate-binding protein [Salinispora arenicola]MCN0179909.1 thiamine pyrophosphate-binding protein [Salinispora arenicola]NIL57621.1 alpha-keto acid decarboxylase family protein [Salinispora arenicola]NIL61868.1 alpha-keto acid decarboxylase family protein [Salinispora arenicola]
MVGGSGGSVTVGELLLGRLHDLGVRHVFGVPGDYAMDFIDQIMTFDGIDWIGSSSEFNAGCSADGYARVAGVGAIVTQFGVGELSTMNALAGAMAESVPIVSVVGGPMLEVMRQRTSIHHSLADGDSERWIRMAREVTVAQASLTPECALQEIDRVLAECWSQQRPVYIRIPGDVAIAPVSRPSRRFTRPNPVVLPAQLDAFAAAAQRLLAGAERPALLVGNLPIRLGLGAAVAALANERNWPIATQMLGRGLVDETDPHYIGIYNGAESSAPVREVVEGADVLVCLGTTFFDWNGLFTAELDPARIINLRRDGAVVGGTCFAPVSMAAALDRLHEMAASRSVGWPSAALLHDPPEIDRASTDPIRQERLWSAVQDVLRPGDILVSEVGTAFFGAATMRLPAGTTVLAAPIWSLAGYTTPAAFGAGIAAPDRRVVSITGDGGIQISPQEISRMFVFDQHPIIFVVNNGGYSSERALEKAVGEETQAYTQIPDWRYSEIPAVFAPEGTFVAHVARTEAELAGILAGVDGRTDRLTLIEVIVDPTDLPPGLPQWSQEASAFIYHAQFPAPASLPWGGLG